MGAIVNVVGTICPSWSRQGYLTDLLNSGGVTPSSRQAYNGYKALGATDTRIELYANADSEKTTHFEVLKLQNTGR